MKNIVIVALLAGMVATGAILAACGSDTPPAASPSSAPADSSATPAARGSAAPQ
jgi:hypothetical protein